MNDLFRLQTQFQDYLLNTNPTFQNAIAHTNKIPTETRLAIYSNAYRSRLIEALAANYPMLQIHLGHDQFEKLAQAYLDTYPSSFRSIRWFGNQLSSFLRKQPCYAELPYLSELAQFEWTLTLVFDAADSPTLQIEEMMNIPVEAWVTMRLQAHPSVYRLALSWNVVQIWQALLEGRPPPELTQSVNPVNWVLWRKLLTNQFCSLTEDEAWAIDKMREGESFGAICEGLCQWMTEEAAGLRAASLLKGWISEGLIEKIENIY